MDNNKTLEIKVLFPGFCTVTGTVMKTNCTCTLIKGPPNCIIDTMTAWDGSKILQALKEYDLSPDDINYVICTHGHSDHVGNNYLFKKAIHIVGFSISQEERYFLYPDFSNGEEYNISNEIKVIPTPGHTLQDVTVIVKKDEKIYAITGDLFEKEQDLENEDIWISAGSDNVDLQRKNRSKILKIANFIIPGHGPMFEVPVKYHEVGLLG